MNSSHGNTAYGVDRTDPKLNGFSKGNCAHCHEQHASIDGGEPAPTGGPSPFALFDDNHTNQTTNFCFDCHVNTGSIQDSGLANRSYSYRAGGWLADPVNGIKAAFSLSTSHSLDDISTFITGRWGYTSSSNPCAACHNQHASQADPANDPTSPKTIGTRGYPLSRPSAHAVLKTWGLWGDAAGEKMDAYALGYRYQAPYRFASATAYEPDGSGTTNGSNLTDFVSFCTDCHNSSTDPADDIVSTSLARNLYKFDWTLEKHGKASATDDGFLPTDQELPYLDMNLGQYIVACTDCHEPHGSPNDFLIRREVNKLNVTFPSDLPADPLRDKSWRELCITCHTQNGNSLGQPHHATVLTNPPYNFGCLDCHTMDASFNFLAPTCSDCHYHGSTDVKKVSGVIIPYNAGEHLF